MRNATVNTVAPLMAVAAAMSGNLYTSGHMNPSGGMDSGPCPGQFFARSPAQRAKRRRRQGRR